MVLSFGEVLMDCLPEKNVIGGAPLNVVTHLNRLGEKSGIISKIGTDELGSEILAFLKSENIAEHVQLDSKHNTGYVSVKLTNGQASYTIHRDCGWEFIDYVAKKESPNYFVFGSLALHLPANREVFLQYVKEFQGAIRLCDINLRTPFYNEETIDFCFNNADILKINDDELAYFGELKGADDPIQLIKTKYGIQKIILTKGAEGAEVFWQGRHYVSEAGQVSDFKDTVGAGDSFTALFIYGLIKGIEIPENLKRASDFSAMICGQNGAIPTDRTIYNGFVVA